MVAKLSLIVFTSSSCEPCKRYKPLIEKLEKEEFLDIHTFDINEEQELGESYNVKSVPTTFIFRNDKLIERFSGVPENYESLVEGLKHVKGTN